MRRLSHTMMEVCINNNATNSFHGRPKRDFRIQVIEMCESPKWFVWPSRNRSSSSEDVDENHNKGPKTTAGPSSSTKEYPTPCATQNGYGAMRRSVLRSSKRMQMDTEGAAPSPRTASEPAPRRLSLKKEKAATEPLSGPSTSFKILSIAKKWESFDATDNDEEEEELSASCQTLVLGNH